MRSASRSSFTLDVIRHKSGVDGLKKAFREIANTDRESAAGMLNADRTEFPTLFALHPEIHKYDLHARLNDRNSTALEISDEILNGTIRESYRKHVANPGALRWMVETGYASDGMSEHYNEVMDNATLMLTKACRDRDCLRYVAEMFFNRNRTGTYTHDLVWAFFEASGPEHLFLIADRLRSRDPKDQEMARDLLNFIPCISAEKSPLNQHRCAVNWLRRNLRRLRYTGESYQQRANPQRYELVSSQGASGGAR